MTDIELPFETRAVARGTDPDTSWEAARSQEPARLRQSQQAVLNVLRWFPAGLNDEQLRYQVAAHGYHISDSGLRTRRSELVRLGLVEDSGYRDVMASGRRAIVWRVAS